MSLTLPAAAQAEVPQSPDSRGAMAWQLSVINGGQSRANGTARAAAVARSWPAPAPGAALAWWEQQLGPVWPVRGHRVQFGTLPGWPVAGDFNGDGFTELGLYHQGQWWIDLNGNGRWDEDDLWMQLGTAADRPVVGDWDGDGKSDIGVFGPASPALVQAAREARGLPNPHSMLVAARKNTAQADGELVRHMRLTARGPLRTDVIEHVFVFGSAGDLPVVGDWTNCGCDSIGVFRDGQWLLDVDGDGHFSAGDLSVALGSPGDLPVVADFDGDGQTALGVYRQGQWWFDTNGDQQFAAGDRTFAFGSDRDLPLVGDWDGDGRDQVGLFHAP